MKLPSTCRKIYTKPADLNEKAPEQAVRIQESFEELGV
jgi:hypothetical protein